MIKFVTACTKNKKDVVSAPILSFYNPVINILEKNKSCQKMSRSKGKKSEKDSISCTTTTSLCVNFR